ncbi:hypothetical protein MMC22_000578 [Lobaria immixta]|nr:hypothetical protein [Lobaria immixta]
MSPRPHSPNLQTQGLVCFLGKELPDAGKGSGGRFIDVGSEDRGPVSAYAAEGMIEEVNTLGPRDVAEKKTFDFGVVVCFYGFVRGEGFLGGGDAGVYGREGVSGEDILGFAAPDVIDCD